MSSSQFWRSSWSIPTAFGEREAFDAVAVIVIGNYRETEIGCQLAGGPAATLRRIPSSVDERDAKSTRMYVVGCERRAVRLECAGPFTPLQKVRCMSSATESNDAATAEFDPVFLHARREAVVIFGVWFVALLWSVPYCYYHGYVTEFDPATFETTLGIPSWLFYGILVPWLAADVFTLWFCFFYMEEDDLGEAHEGADVEEDRRDLHEGSSRR